MSATMLTSQRLPEGQSVSKEAASRGVTDVLKVPALDRSRTFRLGSLALPEFSLLPPPAPQQQDFQQQLRRQPSSVNGAISAATGRPLNLPVTAAVTYRFSPGQASHRQRHPVVHAHHSGEVASHGNVQRFPLEGRAQPSELASVTASVQQLEPAVQLGEQLGGAEQLSQASSHLVEASLQLAAKAAGEDWAAVSVLRAGSDKLPRKPLVAL